MPDQRVPERVGGTVFVLRLAFVKIGSLNVVTDDGKIENFGLCDKTVRATAAVARPVRFIVCVRLSRCAQEASETLRKYW